MLATWRGQEEQSGHFQSNALVAQWNVGIPTPEHSQRASIAEHTQFQNPEPVWEIETPRGMFSLCNEMLTDSKEKATVEAQWQKSLMAPSLFSGQH